VVYAALDSGRLRGRGAPGQGQRALVWRIQPDEARAWYEAFVAKMPVQPVSPQPWPVILPLLVFVAARRRARPWGLPDLRERRQAGARRSPAPSSAPPPPRPPAARAALDLVQRWLIGVAAAAVAGAAKEATTRVRTTPTRRTPSPPSPAAPAARSRSPWSGGSDAC
jgi:hypothetical protein